MALLFSSTNKAEADDFLASVSASRPLAEIRQNDGTWEVHDLPVGYFSPAMLEDMVQRVVERVLQILNNNGGG